MSDQAGYKAPRWARWVATGFGSGYLKPAPGTWGSVAALLAWALFMQVMTALGIVHGDDAFTSAGTLSHPVISFLPLAGTALGAWVWIKLGIKASTLYARELRVEDPGAIVVDEWAGLWISLIPIAAALPFSAPLRTLTHWTDLSQVGWSPWQYLAPSLVAFVAFRLFDIWKPWPCRQVQALPEGEGIMADDIVAGLYAAMVVLVYLQLDRWRVIPWPIPQQLWHH